MSRASYVDLQTNGHGGIDFLSATTTDEIRTATRSLYQAGVAAFLPTLITADPNQLLASARLIREVRESQSPDEAKILGFHLEGPFISHEKCGAVSYTHLTLPTIYSV